MSKEDLIQAFDLIRAHEDDADFVGPCDEETIRKAEETLGIRFPPTYRRFIQTYGCGDIAGEEFYGILHDDFQNSGIPDAVWLTLVERQHGLPEHLVIIYSRGDGTYYTLDASRPNTRGEYPVVAWTPGLSEPDKPLEVVASDFGEFLKRTLDEAL